MAAEALPRICQLPTAHLAVSPLDLLTLDMQEQPELDVPPHLMPGMRLQHYKGDQYRVEGACPIEATLETGILYRPEQGNATHVLWMRPASAFDELVDTDQGQVCRFTQV